MIFHVYQDRKREWRFKLVATNGEIIATGESYKRRSDCDRAIELIRQSAGAEIVEEKPPYRRKTG